MPILTCTQQENSFTPHTHALVHCNYSPTCNGSLLTGSMTLPDSFIMPKAMHVTARAWSLAVSSNPAATMYASPIVSTCREHNQFPPQHQSTEDALTLYTLYFSDW